MRKVNIRDREVDDLCADMMLNKKELIKKIVEFRDKTGITKENQRVMNDIKQRMTTAMRQLMTDAQAMVNEKKTKTKAERDSRRASSTIEEVSECSGSSQGGEGKKKSFGKS